MSVTSTDQCTPVWPVWPPGPQREVEGPCPEIRRALAVIKPENRAEWRQIYELCYMAVCTPMVSALDALDVLTDLRIQQGHVTPPTSLNVLPDKALSPGMCSQTRPLARRTGRGLGRASIPSMTATSISGLGRIGAHGQSTTRSHAGEVRNNTRRPS